MTERDVILRERRASATARCAALHFAFYEHYKSTFSGHSSYSQPPCALCIEKAVSRYPLPDGTLAGAGSASEAGEERA
jgi:hypothetical protein